ncbi:uncharacterized protein NPIL_161161 [Nephila pilipes]|uniref:Uncharacterized protein n=1 Tax=Nephila pilipes TaxID=299642 RepID=A0A8X6ML51_NEPPI|nr:uncharacterized protein NPIL_161161 [Nephila pilipes]
MEAVINKLTIYYGNAIRANAQNVSEMRQAIWAVWAHSTSTDDETKHRFCPKGSDSWCKYNVLEFNHKAQVFKNKNNLPKAVSEAIKQVLRIYHI